MGKQIWQLSRLGVMHGLLHYHLAHCAALPRWLQRSPCCSAALKSWKAWHMLRLGRSGTSAHHQRCVATLRPLLADSRWQTEILWLSGSNARVCCALPCLAMTGCIAGDALLGFAPHAAATMGLVPLLLLCESSFHACRSAVSCSRC